MGTRLRIFWITLLGLLGIGVIVLLMWGVPSPSVEVRKKIPIQTLVGRDSAAR